MNSPLNKIKRALTIEKIKAVKKILFLVYKKKKQKNNKSKNDCIEADEI